MGGNHILKKFKIGWEDGLLLTARNGFIWRAASPEDALFFIPLTDSYGILLPETNIANLSGDESCYKLFAYNGETDRTSAYFVRKICRDDKIILQNPKNCLFFSMRNSKGLPGYHCYSDVISKFEQFSLIMSGYCNNVCKDQLEIIKRLFLDNKEALKLDLATLSRVVIDIMIQILDLPTLEQVFSSYFNENGISFLRNKFKGDFLIGNGLIKEPMKHISELGPVFEPVKWYYLQVRNREAGQVINQIFRKRIKPNRKSCIVTSARNEGIYLLEFIAYYKSLGFDSLFIYSIAICP